MEIKRFWGYNLVIRDQEPEFFGDPPRQQIQDFQHQNQAKGQDQNDSISSTAYTYHPLTGKATRSVGVLTGKLTVTIPGRAVAAVRPNKRKISIQNPSATSMETKTEPVSTDIIRHTKPKCQRAYSDTPERNPKLRKFKAEQEWEPEEEVEVDTISLQSATSF